jgi:hypothetical protein
VTESLTISKTFPGGVDSVPHRLLALRGVQSEWVNPGNPTRVMDTLARNRIGPVWLSQMRAVEKQSFG